MEKTSLSVGKKWTEGLRILGTCESLTLGVYKCKVLQHNTEVQELLSFIKKSPFFM